MTRYLISTQGVFEISIRELGEKTTRAFERMLVDYEVVAINIENPEDRKRAIVGVSRELFDDFPSIKVPVSLDLLLLRFFVEHLEFGSLEDLSSPGGTVLLHSNYKTYLGAEVDDPEADITIRGKFRDAVRTKPDNNISIEDLFISTNLHFGAIQRSLNLLVAADELDEADNLYQAKPSLLSGVDMTDETQSLGQDKSNKTTLYLLDLDNNEFYYIYYGSYPWDFGRKLDIIFSLHNSNDELIYENVIGIVSNRKDEDIAPAVRYFLHLFRNNEPKSQGEGDYFLAEDLRNQYQFPIKVDDKILAGRLLEALETFAGFKPHKGLSTFDLMVSLDVNHQPLVRSINRLVERGIIEGVISEAEGAKYIIIDHEKADNYLLKFREEMALGPRQSVTYTIKVFRDVSSPGQDGVSYELIYEAVDSELIGSPEESASTRHGIIGISGSRSLQSVWGLNSGEYKKILFETAKRKLEGNIKREEYDVEEMRLFTNNSPDEVPYDPERISIVLSESKEVEIGAKRISEPVRKEWDVFICHASEDKETFVDPLAHALKDTGLKVWYADFILRVGDSLRHSIDEGLAKSRFGVVVLSRNFFKIKKAWPKRELGALFALEEGGSKGILPVWHKIDEEYLKSVSPMLADRVATNSSLGIDRVVQDIRLAMGEEEESD